MSLLYKINIGGTRYPSYQCVGEVKRYPLMYYGECLLSGSRATSIQLINVICHCIGSTSYIPHISVLVRSN